MLPSVVRTFSDADDYAAAIRQGTVEMTVTGCGHFAAKLTRIDLHSLWMQRFSENLPRIAHETVRHSHAQSYYQHSFGLACFGSMSLPVEDITTVGATMAGTDQTPPRDTLIVTPPPSAMAKLQRLHTAAAHLTESTPEVIANPDAARGLEQALIEGMVDCLGKSEAREDGVAQRQHELIMRRFRRAVEEIPGQPLYIPEICRAIGSPDGPCGCAARSSGGWGRSVTCCSAACIWRGGRCGRHRRMRRL